MQSTKDRITIFLKYIGIGQAKFAEIIGVSRGYVNNMTGNPTQKVLQSIASSYPELDINWLLTGEGEMIKANIQVIHNSKTNEKGYEQQDILLYDIEAAANLKTLFDNKSQNILDTLRIPNMPKVDGAVYVKGDSMYPLLKSGDIVIYKQIYNLETDIFLGEMYLISMEVSGDEYVVVKYVNKSEIDGCIKLVSYNTHHQPKDVHLSTIRAMAIVKASVRLNM